jgi:8-oxo-dGTP diphosphatase
MSRLAARVAGLSDWPILPCPDQRAQFELDIVLSGEEAARVRQGLIPQGSDDRWFLFVEDDVLYCHRSWTGACVFGARLAVERDVTRLVDCWVSRDADAYDSTNIEADRADFRALLESHLIYRQE